MGFDCFLHFSSVFLVIWLYIEQISHGKFKTNVFGNRINWIFPQRFQEQQFKLKCCAIQIHLRHSTNSILFDLRSDRCEIDLWKKSFLFGLVRILIVCYSLSVNFSRFSEFILSVFFFLCEKKKISVQKVNTKCICAID